MTNESIKKYVEAIEAHQESIAKLQEQIKEDIADFRVSIKRLFERAGDEGIDTRALKSAIKVRAVERKIEGVSRTNYDQIPLALGDLAGTPLGDAAMAANGDTKPRRRRPADVASDVTMAG